MEIYFMDLKEFVKHFVKMMDHEDVLNYQYVLISSTLKSNRSRDNVAKMSNLLPSHSVCSDWMCNHQEDEFVENYYEELNDQRIAILGMLDCILTEKTDTIFINAPSENKRIPYMEVLSAFIYNEFGVPVYDFKKLRQGKEEFIKWDEKSVTEKVHKAVVKYRKNAVKIGDMTNHQRNEYLKTLTKKELKRELKKIGYPKSDVNEMGRGEIIHLLNKYYF